MFKLDDWKTGDPLLAAKLQQAVEALRTTANILGAGEGTEVFQTLGGTTIRSAQQPAASISPVLLVKVTGSYDGGAVYSGYVWDPPTANVDPTVDATESTLGTRGEEIIIINLQELGFSTHDLTDSGQTVTIFLAAWLPVVATTGLSVAVICGEDWEDCTT